MSSEDLKTEGCVARLWRAPPVWLVHVGLIVNQMAFGGGSVVGKIGLTNKGHSVPPLIFALIREGLSGPLLCLMAWYTERAKLNWREDWWRFLITGLCLYTNQLLFIVGLGLSNATEASIWQPSQPIFTAAIAMCLTWEKPTFYKVTGILLAAGGAMFMVAYGKTAADILENSTAAICFFFNCLATSLYVIFSKPLLKKYPPMSVTGWSYIVASVFMAASSFRYVHDKQAWSIPPLTWVALAYWVIFTSIIAYLLMTWANQFADASIVSAYSTLQPLTAAVLTYVFFKKAPTTPDLGGLGILLGLGLVVYSQRTEATSGEGDSAASKKTDEAVNESSPLIEHAADRA